MKTWIWAVIGVIAAFLFGYWFGGKNVEVVETTTIDTVFFEKPTPISTSDITVSVNVPKLVFARDTVMLLADTGNVASSVASQTNQATNYVSNYDSETATYRHGSDSTIKNYLNTDSVRMQVTVRTLEYRDSTYYARVVGPVVGPLAPRLDFIETYNKTITRTVTKKPRFAVTAGAGVGWTPKGIQPVVGVQAGVILWSR